MSYELFPVWEYYNNNSMNISVSPGAHDPVFLRDKYIGMELMGHRIVGFSTLAGNTKLFSKWLNIPIAGLFHILAYTWYCGSF